VQKADNSALLRQIAQLERPLREGRKTLRREQRSQALKNGDLRQPSEGRGPFRSSALPPQVE
jgi:hypothetical protein